MAQDRRHRKRLVVYRARVASSDELLELEYPAVADALHFACRDLRDGRREPLEILEDGVQVYDAEGIEAACRERMDEMAKEHGLA